MKAKLYKCATEETKEIDTQFLTLRQWIEINFSFWFFWQVKKTGKNSYEIINKSTGKTEYKIN
jgi:hypothetical protein